MITDIGMGEPEGKLAKAGRKVVVDYVGRLQKTGKVFDESKPKGFTFRLGMPGCVAEFLLAEQPLSALSMPGCQLDCCMHARNNLLMLCSLLACCAIC